MPIVEKKFSSSEVLEKLFKNNEMIRVDEFEQICKDSNFLNAKSSEINILITKLLDTEQKSYIEKKFFKEILNWFHPLVSFSPYNNEHELKGFKIKDIAQLLKEPWFRGRISAEVADQELSGKPQGSFLIRFSLSTPGDYALALVTEKGSPPEHHRLQAGPLDLPGSIMFEKKVYESLYKFIEELSTHPLPNGVLLRKGQVLIKSKIQGDVKIMNKIGSGQYGDVYMGSWTGNKIAAKKVKNSFEIESFEEEIRLLQKIKHPNVVDTYGIYVKSGNPEEYYIITQYCSEGNLKAMLKNTENSISQEEKLMIARNIAAGMIGLNSHKIVHRNLAARNILLNLEYNGKKSVLKALVSDFAIGEYSKEETHGIEQKWIAPEVLLTEMEYSNKSDVWSYGITLFELLEDGKDPFSNLTVDELKKAFLEKRKITDILHITADVNPKFLELIYSCLNYDPDKRPTFDQIDKQLETFQLEELKTSSELKDDFDNSKSSKPTSNYYDEEEKQVSAEYKEESEEEEEEKEEKKENKAPKKIVDEKLKQFLLNNDMEHLYPIFTEKLNVGYNELPQLTEAVLTTQCNLRISKAKSLLKSIKEVFSDRGYN